MRVRQVRELAIPSGDDRPDREGGKAGLIVPPISFHINLSRLRYMGHISRRHDDLVEKFDPEEKTQEDEKVRRQKAAEKRARESGRRRAAHARRLPAPDRTDEAGRSSERDDILLRDAPIAISHGLILVEALDLVVERFVARTGGTLRKSGASTMFKGKYNSATISATAARNSLWCSGTSA